MYNHPDGAILSDSRSSGEATPIEGKVHRGLPINIWVGMGPTLTANGKIFIKTFIQSTGLKLHFDW